MCPELSALIRKYDERLGNLGRGHQLQIEEIIPIVRKLRQNGFVQYQTPGRSGPDGKYIPLYDSISDECSGIPAGGVWFGFVRGDNADIVTFEVGFLADKEFHKKTGLTLAQAIEGAY